tara:strand:- start:1382 stop:1996 length:615 start_codon:yes stop_codon:yes gene_type:complete
MDREHFDNIVSKIKTPDVMFDIGVATINTEAWWASKVWKDTQIYGFEPCSSRFNSISNYPGILHKMAVTDISGKFDGYMNNYDFKINAEEDDSDPYIKTTVESITIDNLNKKYGPFENIFIWADVEGGELSILKGSVDLLKEKKICGINLELWSNPPVENWPTCDEIVEYLRDFDYHVSFSVNGDYESWDRTTQEDFLFLPGKD